MKSSQWTMLVGLALLAGCARNKIHGYPRFWPKLVDEPAEIMPAVPCVLVQPCSAAAPAPAALTNAPQDTRQEAHAAS
jgi:hypothetical protein